MARLQALTLLVSVLSASAFAPFGWASNARTEPVRAANYLESVSSLRAAGLIVSLPTAAQLGRRQRRRGRSGRKRQLPSRRGVSY